MKNFKWYVPVLRIVYYNEIRPRIKDVIDDVETEWDDKFLETLDLFIEYMIDRW